VKATEVTAGLAESNGSLLPGLWRDSLHVTCGRVWENYTFTFLPCVHGKVSPVGISISSAAFAQLIRVSNTLTDTQTTPRQTSLAVGRILAQLLRYAA